MKNIKNTHDIPQNDSFVALKITSLVPPHVLQRWTAILDALYASFTKHAENGILTDKGLNALVKQFPSFNKAKLEDALKGHSISWTHLTSVVSLHRPEFARMMVNESFSEQDVQTATLVLEPIKEFIHKGIILNNMKASSKNVQIMMVSHF